MTFINQLIKKAKAGANLVEVPESHVRSVAEHIRRHTYAPVSHEDCEKALRIGGVRLLGARMVVKRRIGS